MRTRLRVMLDRLETRYQTKPLVYVTGEAYETFLDSRFDDCPLWIRSVFTHPSVWGYRPWTFWQYSCRGRLRGTGGQEAFVDLNVFRGSEERFRQQY